MIIQRGPTLPKKTVIGRDMNVYYSDGSKETQAYPEHLVEQSRLLTEALQEKYKLEEELKHAKENAVTNIKVDPTFKGGRIAVMREFGKALKMWNANFANGTNLDAYLNRVKQLIATEKNKDGSPVDSAAFKEFTEKASKVDDRVREHLCAVGAIKAKFGAFKEIETLAGDLETQLEKTSNDAYSLWDSMNHLVDEDDD